MVWALMVLRALSAAAPRLALAIPVPVLVPVR